jgi:hypothetical protein
MRIITKLFILLIIGVIAVILLNVLIHVNAESLFIQSDDNAGSDVSTSPTLLAPVQEQDTASVSGQSYNCLLYLLGLVGVIGIMAIGINYMKRN